MESIGDLRIENAALKVERDDLRRQVQDLRRTVDAVERYHTSRIDDLTGRLHERTEEFLTVREFARMARMTRRNLDRYRGRADFPKHRVIGRRHLYVTEEALEWILRQTT